MRTRPGLFVGVLCLLCVTQVSAWMINEDYQQRDARPATDFHIWLVGDVRDQITAGGESIVTNPFPDPTRSTELTDIGNTMVTFEGSGSLAQDLDTDRHFGIFGTGPKPRVRFKAWSYATAPNIIPVPKSNVDYAYDPDTQELTITVENISDDTVTFSDFGYLLSLEERPIDHLTRAVLPPGAFIPLPELNREYLVGETESIVLPGVDPAMYVTTYATVTFTGDSADNPYNEFGTGTGGEWAQVAVMDQVLGGAIPTVSQWGLIVMALMLLVAATVILRHRHRAVATAAIACLAILPAAGYAWERGNHAGRWDAGATLRVCVEAPPGTPEEQAEFWEAVYEACDEWNDAQAAHGGLTLEPEPAKGDDCDINITWHDDREESTAPGGPPVEVHIGYDGLDSRGLTRVLKHELGHAEGLGHSDASDIMPQDAFSSDPPNPPSDDDLNSEDDFETPNDDDIAGKKAMYGTVPEQNASEASGTATEGGGGEDLWRYDYTLSALEGPGYIVPVTQFTLSLPLGVEAEDFTVTVVPPGWEWEFLDGYVVPGGRFDDGEVEAPSYLIFQAMSPEFGVLPGQFVEFQLDSPLPPADSRAFTNSPSHDSDEFLLVAPAPLEAPIPTVSEWGLIIMTLLLLVAGTIIFARRRKPQVA